MEEQQQQPQQRKGIPLDLDTLLDDTPAAELVVKPSAMASDQEPQSVVLGLEELKDYELDEQIRRKKNTLNTSGKNLPDRGAKLRAVIRCYEEEVLRRKLNPPPQKVNEKQATTSSDSVGEGLVLKA
ncbi:hypothetical protein TSUD_186960 [Trifolium subterraneum]|uniref:Uncharacterized protein n=1 Tax=Trifolium subterraneum TaxID=3900 RepID=A0A2Z6P0Q9_TRISU|nr:hypothetical protein TSUD_186960 [Trifolium subterraneum]